MTKTFVVVVAAFFAPLAMAEEQDSLAAADRLMILRSRQKELKDRLTALERDGIPAEVQAKLRAAVLGAPEDHKKAAASREKCEEIARSEMAAGEKRRAEELAKENRVGLSDLFPNHEAKLTAAVEGAMKKFAAVFEVQRKHVVGGVSAELLRLKPDYPPAQVLNSRLAANPKFDSIKPQLETELMDHLERRIAETRLFLFAENESEKSSIVSSVLKDLGQFVALNDVAKALADVPHKLVTAGSIEQHGQLQLKADITQAAQTNPAAKNYGTALPFIRKPLADAASAMEAQRFSDYVKNADMGLDAAAIEKEISGGDRQVHRVLSTSIEQFEATLALAARQRVAQSYAQVHGLNGSEAEHFAKLFVGNLVHTAFKTALRAKLAEIESGVRAQIAAEEINRHFGTVLRPDFVPPEAVIPAPVGSLEAIKSLPLAKLCALVGITVTPSVLLEETEQQAAEACAVVICEAAAALKAQFVVFEEKVRAPPQRLKDLVEKHSKDEIVKIWSDETWRLWQAEIQRHRRAPPGQLFAYVSREITTSASEFYTVAQALRVAEKKEEERESAARVTREVEAQAVREQAAREAADREAAARKAREAAERAEREAADREAGERAAREGAKQEQGGVSPGAENGSSEKAGTARSDASGGNNSGGAGAPVASHSAATGDGEGAVGAPDAGSGAGKGGALAGLAAGPLGGGGRGGKCQGCVARDLRIGALGGNLSELQSHIGELNGRIRDLENRGPDWVQLLLVALFVSAVSYTLGRLHQRHVDRRGLVAKV